MIKNTYIDNKKIEILSVNHKHTNRVLRAMDIVSGIHSFINQEKPHIVISFLWQVNVYTILGKMFTRTKLIISERNDPYQDPSSKILRKIRDCLYNFSDGYVFQTEDARKYFCNKISEKGRVIANPIKENLPYWNENSSKIIITACRITRQKNLFMLIDAVENIIKDYPDYRLKIFGFGDLEKEVSNYISSKGLEKYISLPGFSENIHSEMVNSEIFIISSDYEGISNSMLEALAIGIPVISTDSPIGGARMFINSGKNGLLVEVGDVEQLTNAIIFIINNKEKANEMSKESRKIRTLLSPKKVASQWIEYIDEVCGGEKWN